MHGTESCSPYMRMSQADRTGSPENRYCTGVLLVANTVQHPKSFHSQSLANFAYIVQLEYETSITMPSVPSSPLTNYDYRKHPALAWEMHLRCRARRLTLNSAETFTIRGVPDGQRQELVSSKRHWRIGKRLRCTGSIRSRCCSIRRSIDVA
jgi:hypothetical protein